MSKITIKCGRRGCSNVSTVFTEDVVGTPVAPSRLEDNVALWELYKAAGHKKRGEKKVYLCPKCVAAFDAMERVFHGDSDETGVAA